SESAGRPYADFRRSTSSPDERGSGSPGRRCGTAGTRPTVAQSLSASTSNDPFTWATQNGGSPSGRAAGLWQSWAEHSIWVSSGVVFTQKRYDELVTSKPWINRQN